MNREDLFSAITDIRDDYIVEADPAKRAPAPLHRKLRPWLSMAAALIVVIGLVALAKNLPMFRSKAEPAAEEAAMAVRDTDGTAEEAVSAEAPEVDAAMQESAEEECIVEEPAEEAPAAEASMEDFQDEAGGSGEELNERDENHLEQEAIRPQQILWNGTAYVRSGETLDESPAGFDYAGMLETDPEAEFYADDPASSGYSIYTSGDDTERLYLAVPEGFLGYELP